MSDAPAAPPPAVPRLHVVTPDRDAVEVLRVVDAALAAGAPCVQLRIKRGSDRERLELAASVVARCRAARACCIVNDRLDLALAAGADGVHLGADDLPVAAARAVAGGRLLIGGTARDPDTARRLVAEGADYLGVGPVYPTRTKSGLPDPLGPARLAEVAGAVTAPVVAIAGVTAERLPEVLAHGAHGAAVIGAVAEAEDPAAATRRLVECLAGATALGRR